MFRIYSWIKNLTLLVGFLLLISCIFIAEQKYAQQLCKTIDIEIGKNKDQFFINEKDMLAYLAENKIDKLNNIPLKQIKSRKIEKIIRSHDFVRLCTAYKSWKGNLKITILPKRIVARMVRPFDSDCYIDELGATIPLSTSYTARILLVNSEILGKLKDALQDIPYGKAILEIFNLIDKDPFWKAQITHISLDNNNELIMYTQFNRHKIYFGKPDNIENKMKKLKIFYKSILPYKGWNGYKQVNLKFDNQIVCE